MITYTNEDCVDGNMMPERGQTLYDIYNLYTTHSIYKQVEWWCVLDEKGGCINGHWSEDTLLRMYDQTVGYLQAIRTFYTADEANN